MKKQIFFYIDGTNLFAGQNELFGPNKYLSFSSLIKEVKKIFPIDNIYFYASYMSEINKRKLSLKKVRIAEALFYREVKFYQGITFFKGYRSPTSGKEKGVDVHLASDIVKDVILGNCKEIVIMTGDADFIYPIEIAKKFNVKTGAVFLSNRFSLEIAYKVDTAYVLDYKDQFKSKRRLPRQLKIIKIKSPVCKHTG